MPTVSEHNSEIVTLLFVILLRDRSILLRRTCSDLYCALEIRSVERGICPIATSTMNELFIVAGCMAHARNGCISTSGLKSDVTIVFLDPDFF